MQTKSMERRIEKLESKKAEKNGYSPIKRVFIRCQNREGPDRNSRRFDECETACPSEEIFEKAVEAASNDPQKPETFGFPQLIEVDEPFVLRLLNELEKRGIRVENANKEHGKEDRDIGR